MDSSPHNTLIKTCLPAQAIFSNSRRLSLKRDLLPGEFIRESLPSAEDPGQKPVLASAGLRVASGCSELCGAAEKRLGRIRPDPTIIGTLLEGRRHRNPTREWQIRYFSPLLPHGRRQKRREHRRTGIHKYPGTTFLCQEASWTNADHGLDSTRQKFVTCACLVIERLHFPTWS